jgi:hypothetical protein
MGAAASAWHLNGTTVFELLPFAGVVGALIAVPFGLIALRVRRHTFIVITIAFFFIFQLMAYNLSFTHGTIGMNAPFLSWPASGYDIPFYYIGLAYAAGTIAIAWLIRRSRFGLQLRAIRDDEDRARGLGVKAMRVKLSAPVIRRDHRDDRVGVVLLRDAGPAEHRLRPAVRPDDRADGVPRRLRLDRRHGARRADHRADHALAEHPAAVLRRVPE